MTLAQRVRSARQKRNLSARALDIEAKIAVGHTALIESGERTEISIVTASKLARALGVSLDWLVDGKGKGPASIPPPRAA